MLTMLDVAAYVTAWHNGQIVDRSDDDEDDLSLDIGGFERRMDQRETAFLVRQLEHIKARTFDIRYPTLKARQFIPVDTSAPSGAESITYRQWDQYGVAKIIANYGDDLPRVDVVAKEFSVKPKPLGAAYGFSIQDMRAAAMSGTQLDARRAAAARRAVESGIDEIAAIGNAAAGLLGLANNPNVPVIAPDTGAWTATTDPLLIIADLNKLVQSIITTSKDIWRPDTLLLPTEQFGLLAQMYLSADNDKTVLRSYLDNSPYIRNIDQWHKLDLADAAGTGPRMIAYARSSEVMSLEIPQDFEQFPPEKRNLEFVVDTHARTAGVIMYYPLAVAYMDGI